VRAQAALPSRRETGFTASLEAGSSRLLDDGARFDGGCRREKQLDGAA